MFGLCKFSSFELRESKRDCSCLKQPSLKLIWQREISMGKSLKALHPYAYNEVRASKQRCIRARMGDGTQYKVLVSHSLARPIMAPGCINQIAVGKRFIACAIGKAKFSM